MDDNITTASHPYQCRVRADLMYYDEERVIGSSDADPEYLLKFAGKVPISVTIGDNCCEDHARLAATHVLEREHKRRQTEEERLGSAGCIIHLAVCGVSYAEFTYTEKRGEEV